MLRTSTKIALGVGLTLGGGYLVYSKVSESMAMSRVFAEIRPTKVCIVGVAPGAGYRIVVANSVAQLVQVQEGFKGKESDGEGATEGAVKSRLPMRDLLLALDGDIKAISELVARLNNMGENDRWPPRRVVWRAEKLRAAFAGDQVLVQELERDLNMRLDGTPLPTVRRQSLEDGIIIDYPVFLNLSIGGVKQRVEARVQAPYRPAMIQVIEKKYEEKPNLSIEVMAGYYSEEAKNIQRDPKTKEDIRKSLESRIDPKRAQELAEKPERVLQYAKVVVNSDQIQASSFDEYEASDGKKFYNMRLSLTDEGRMRIWQYTKSRIGGNLLVVSNGVGIAAPRIQHELAMSPLTVNMIREKRLVKEAIDILNNRNTEPGLNK